MPVSNAPTWLRRLGLPSQRSPEAANDGHSTFVPHSGHTPDSLPYRSYEHLRQYPGRYFRLLRHARSDGTKTTTKGIHNGTPTPVTGPFVRTFGNQHTIPPSQSFQRQPAFSAHKCGLERTNSEPPAKLIILVGLLYPYIRTKLIRSDMIMTHEIVIPRILNLWIVGRRIHSTSSSCDPGHSDYQSSPMKRRVASSLEQGFVYPGSHS